ncbi:MAG: nucleotide exchange factor GrpE, partial [Candidatus ainarchaeum sp.]|nr:nucleotide exchange factor GrpE [Candidatus ainarchaeum sp.]
QEDQEDQEDQEENNSLLEENKKLKEKIISLQEEIKRTIADFSNYKKRLEKEFEVISFEKNKKIILEFISFKEVLNLAINHEKNKEALNNLIQLDNNYQNILNRLNIQKIEVINKDFDYHTSECITRQKIDSEKENNKVVSVIEDGYTYKQKLLKPAKVIVGYLEE